MRIVRKSAYSGKTHAREIEVTEAQLAEWQAGALIQRVMPHLSLDDREFLITGTTPEEWAECFGPHP